MSPAEQAVRALYEHPDAMRALGLAVRQGASRATLSLPRVADERWVLGGATSILDSGEFVAACLSGSETDRRHGRDSHRACLHCDGHGWIR